LKTALSISDAKIGEIDILYGPNSGGDIPHLLASIEKALNILEYSPKFNIQSCLDEAIGWYWKNLK
jgi:UDP-N-acetylglucosamine 4-epimerase